MAVFNAKDVQVTVNSVDLKDHAVTVDVDQSRETSDGSAMGQAARTVTAGLLVPRISITFRNDFASSEVYATMYTLFTAATAHDVLVIPVDTTVAPTNPSFTLTGIITAFPMAFGLGETADITVTWENTAAAGIAVGTS